MKPVFDIYSRQNFESMKLAGEILNIPVTKIKASLKNGNAIVAKDGRKYLFKESRIAETIKLGIKTFPFGKYKGKNIKECKDKSYLEWFLTLDINLYIKRAIKNRLEEL